jgi:hypothetical protein
MHSDTSEQRWWILRSALLVVAATQASVLGNGNGQWSRYQRVAIARLSVAVAALTAMAAATPAVADRASGASPAIRDFQPAELFTGPDRPRLFTTSAMRISLRLPPGAARLQVELNGRNAIRAVQGGGGKRWLELGRSSGVRAGRNHLSAIVVRSGRRLIDARAFYWLRRARGQAGYTVKLRRRDRSGVLVKIASRSPRLDSAASVGEFRRSLGGVRRPRVLRVWLNGRRVETALDSSLRSTWTGSLSATHGLRRGVNLVSVFVAEPERGLYRMSVRRFRIRAGAPLPGAGHDRRTRVGVRIRLDGTASRPSSARRGLSFRWRIVGRPRGSKARLLNPHSVRPSLRPDRPGNYRVRLALSERTAPTHGRAVASQTPSTTDTTTITVNPAAVLILLTTYLFDGASQRWGVSIAGTRYLNPAPGSRGMQVLVLDRNSGNVLNNCAVGTPARAPTPGDPGCSLSIMSVSDLLRTLNAYGLGQLVMLVNPPNLNAPVASNDVGTFNKVLSTLGVPSIPAPMLTNPGQVLSIIGVPRSNAGSGWYVPGGHNGWLSPDTTGRISFAPRRPSFDSSSASAAGTNTMNVNGQQISATTPSGVGWQVVQIDPLSFGVVANQGFGADDPALVSRLQSLAASNSIVAVKNIGGAATDPDGQLGQALIALGASPGALGGSTYDYSLLGGRPLMPADVVEASTSVVTDPIRSPQVTAGGRIVSRLLPAHAGGALAPSAQNFPGSFGQVNDQLYDIVHQAPTAWPYTNTKPDNFPTQFDTIKQQNCPPPGNDAGHYAAALAYIAGPNGIDLPAYASNLRTAYVELDQESWSDEHSTLINMGYPQEQSSNFTEAEFCNLKFELLREFEWLDDVKSLLDSYASPYDREQGQYKVNLSSVSSGIQNSLKPNGSAPILWDLFEGLAEAFNLASFFPAEPILGAALDGVQTAYDLASSFATSNGSPVADRFRSEVKSLGDDSATLYAQTSAALDNLRDIVINDYGRLSALGEVANNPGWVLDSNSIEQTTTMLGTAASRWYTSALMPIAYPGWLIEGPSDATTDNCSVTFGGQHSSYYVPFAGLPGNAQLTLYRGGGPIGAKIMALGSGDPTDTSPFARFNLPPSSLVDPFFLPASQNGLGFVKDWFLLRNFTATSVPCLAIDPSS